MYTYNTVYQYQIKSNKILIITINQSFKFSDVIPNLSDSNYSYNVKKKFGLIQIDKLKFCSSVMCDVVVFDNFYNIYNIILNLDDEYFCVPE